MLRPSSPPGGTFVPFRTNTQGLSIVIDGLIASTSYDLEVIASNSAGTSAASAFATTATISANPFPAPGNVSGAQNTGSAVPILSGPQNGAVLTSTAIAIAGVAIVDAGATNCVLLVTCSSGAVAMTLSGTLATGSGTQSITVTDTFARCQTAAATLTYTGPASATTDTISIKLTDNLARTNTLLIQIQVSVLAPPVSPSAPVVTPSAQTSNSVQLNWPASTGTQPITYTPQFKLSTAPTYTNATATSGLVAVISGLVSATSYDFIVAASNVVTSVPSAKVTTSTLGVIAPSAPLNLQVTATTATTITYSWSPPASGSAPITYQPLTRTAGTGGTRLYYNQGGTNLSVWNTPIGAGAIAGLAGDADTISARFGGFVNPTSNFGAVVWVSTRSTDPVFTFSGHGADYEVVGPNHGSGTPLSVTAHCVAGSFTPGPHGGTFFDGQYVFVDDVNHPGFYYHFAPLDFTNLQAGQGPFTIDFNGNPLSAAVENALSDTFGQDWENQGANGVQAVGIVRAADLDLTLNPARIPGTTLTRIQHALRYGHDASRLKANARTTNNPDFPNGLLNPSSWPELYQDFQSGINVYSGNLIYGTTLYIPMSTAQPGGLTDAGKQLFDCLQRYGSIGREQAGGGYKLYADQNVSTTWTNQANTDLPTLVGLLCPMRNQHQGGQSFVTNPANGPGTRLDTGPPALTGTTVPGNFLPFGSAIPGTSVTVTGLTANTSYDLEVTAINGQGQTTSVAITASTGIPGIPTDATGTQARPAQDLLNRIGINTHFGNGNYSAFTPAQAVAALQLIGVTLVRDSDNG